MHYSSPANQRRASSIAKTKSKGRSRLHQAIAASDWVSATNYAANRLGIPLATFSLYVNGGAACPAWIHEMVRRDFPKLFDSKTPRKQRWAWPLGLSRLKKYLPNL